MSRVSQVLSIPSSYSSSAAKKKKNHCSQTGWQVHIMKYTIICFQRCNFFLKSHSIYFTNWVSHRNNILKYFSFPVDGKVAEGRHEIFTVHDCGGKAVLKPAEDRTKSPKGQSVHREARQTRLKFSSVPVGNGVSSWTSASSSVKWGDCHSQPLQVVLLGTYAQRMV